MIKSISNQIVGVFFLLGICCIPLTFLGKENTFQITLFLFGNSINWIQKNGFPNAIPNIDFSSDTIALNLLLGILFFLSIGIVFIFHLLKLKTTKFPYYSRLIICYYLAFVLLKYAFDKVFKTQFYLPEPNILYTPFGYLTKDILFWSTLGLSYSFSFALGIVELIVAFFLLLHRTRIIGLFFGFFVFFSIVLINFSFDISVKTFSLFLFFASFYAFLPYLKTIFRFFIGLKKEQLVTESKLILGTPVFSFWIKSIVILSMLFMVLFPYFQTKNWNDDLQKRPFLHGAYEVIEVVSKGDTLQKEAFPFVKIFVHRNQYLIFQTHDFQTTDYFFQTNTADKKIILQDYQQKEIPVFYEIFEKDSTFILKFQNTRIKTKRINWKQLPVLNTKNHYTIDEIK